MIRRLNENDASSNIEMKFDIIYNYAQRVVELSKSDSYLRNQLVKLVETGHDEDYEIEDAVEKAQDLMADVRIFMNKLNNRYGR